MSVQTSNRFTTGEFARLCGVTKHTLFHYDEMGIFRPSLKGENGYRYYSLPQLEVFHVITTLRELGMPLREIKAYLDRRSPGELVRLLEREEQALTEKLSVLRRMRRLVRRKAALTREAMETDPDTILLKEEDEAYFVMTPAGSFATSRDTAQALSTHLRWCAEHGISSPYAIGSAIPLEEARAGNFDTGYSHVYTRVDRPPRGVAVCTRPAGTYLTACHVGGYERVGETYGQILRYARDGRLALRGPFYEDSLLDELSVTGYDNYILQMSIFAEPESRGPWV